MLDGSRRVLLRSLLVLDRLLGSRIELHVCDQEHDELSVVLGEDLADHLAHDLCDLVALREEVHVGVVLGHLLDLVLQIHLKDDYLSKEDVVSLDCVSGPLSVDLVDVLRPHAVHYRDLQVYVGGRCSLGSDHGAVASSCERDPVILS